MESIKCVLLIHMVSTISSDKCIDTLEDYRDMFENVIENGSGEYCVSSGLMGSIIGPHSSQNGDCPLNPNQVPDTISDGGNSYYWAWVSGSHNLGIYLDIAEQHPGNRFEVAAEMMRFVGITEEYIHSACSYSMAVFSTQDLVGLFVPTWASFFLALEQSPFNVSLDWEVSRRLVLEGFSNFTGISGCAGTVVDSSCLPEYEETYTLLSLILEEAGTVPCVQEFVEMFKHGKSASLTQARAFFHGCFDANPLFTGLGYGYSSKDSQLTEREYLARNSNLEEIGAALFSLYSPIMAGLEILDQVSITVLTENN